MTGPPPLSEEVRIQVLAMASAALATMGDDDVPRPLRPFQRFTPTRRARAAAGALATALEDDPVFRQRVAESVKDDPVAAAVAAGSVPPAADPVHAAALGYLLRPPGWEELVERATDVASTRARSSTDAAAGARVRRLTEQVEGLRTELRELGRRSRAELAQVSADAESMRRQVREQSQLVRQAEQAAEQAASDLAADRERSVAVQSQLEADLRRVRQRLADADAAIESARRSARQGRVTDDARLWLLLDTVVNAAQGLRRELALTPSDDRPADGVGASTGAVSDISAGIVDDPAQLDRLLILPNLHLLVDGYNVTKTGYGELPLESQRTRLVARMGGLAAQTGAEVTVVFDGAERLPVAPPTPRGVRVLFSPRGQTADELLRRLVAAEPAGRAIVVVSSDREVADGIRRSGAYPVASVTLLRRLDRG